MDEPEKKRVRPHNAEGARQAILKAAEAVFAEHGFDGARIDAIAAASGYNKSLIFQYFGDKLGLYSEVIRRNDWTEGDIQAQILAFLSDDKSPDVNAIREYFAAFLNKLFDYFVENPAITRIFLWEMAEGWQTYRKIVSQHERTDVEKFEPFITKIQTLGLLSPDYNPIAQILMVEFLYVYFMAAIPLFQVFLPDQDFSSPAALENAKKYIQEFVISGLMADHLQQRS